ncbi:MAG: hypothetical protein H0U59_07710 [Gemmatimonadaceae bacterium]|nr:hypothetical protein [Gemmatimonadaceae bacterium]
MDLEHSQARKHGAETVERALHALALTGSAPRASKYLADKGIELGSSTILRWARDTHAERYADIAHQEDERISKLVAAEVQENIRLNTQVQGKLLQRLDETAHTLEGKGASAAYRDLAVGQAVSSDKIVNPIRGRASTIVEHRSVGDLIRRLQALKAVEVIEGTATEILSSPKPEESS